MRAPEFWHRRDPASRAIAAALAPLGLAYGATVGWKRRHRKPYRARARVICVGNLTVGGSGKTPVAIALARTLEDKGARVAFLARGYGRASSGAICVDPERHDACAVGDEALLLARVAPTVVAADRAEGARLAEAGRADIIIMDDGYQNFSLAKDMSLVIVDGESGFGNGRIVPAGPLRESISRGLARAGAVVVMGDGTPRLDGFAGPILRARLAPERRLDGMDCVAFAGIGRPEKFFAMLRRQGARLAESHGFADHHPYTDAEVAELKHRAASRRARLITTEKDWVRLKTTDRDGIETLAVHAEFADMDALDRLLAPIFAR